MKQLLTLVLLTTFVVLLLTFPNHTGAQMDTPRLLVYVPLDAAEQVFANDQLDVYARLQGKHEAYLLAGVAPEQVSQLQKSIPGLRVLDTMTGGETYYLAQILPVHTLPWAPWRANYGRILLDDGHQYLLQTSATKAERLASSGVEIIVIPQSAIALTEITPTHRAVTAVTPDPVIQALMEEANSSALRQTMDAISGQVPTLIGGQPYTITTRHTYSGEPLTKATQYISEHLSTWGLDVTTHTWNAGLPPNVIGEITGQTNPGDIYILSAHLDNMPSGAIAPGADDNGSGTVANLLAAELLSQYKWDCTLRFAFWTGEEQGLLGSDAYATQATAAGKNILGVLNLDMIAHDAAGPPIVDLHTRSWLPGSTTIANTFVDVVEIYSLALQPQILQDNSLGNYSDNKSFWDEGYAAILAIEDRDDFTPYYHTTQDAPHTLNFDYYEAFVKAAVGTFAHTSNCLTAGQTPLPVTPQVDISVEDTAVDLTWPHRTANIRYEVHRHSTPYFTPGVDSWLATLEPPFAASVSYLDDITAQDNSYSNHYYVIVAYNADNASLLSNRVGKFNFDISFIDPILVWLPLLLQYTDLS